MKGLFFAFFLFSIFSFGTDCMYAGDFSMGDQESYNYHHRNHAYHKGFGRYHPYHYRDHRRYDYCYPDYDHYSYEDFHIATSQIQELYESEKAVVIVLDNGMVFRIPPDYYELAEGDEVFVFKKETKNKKMSVNIGTKKVDLDMTQLNRNRIDYYLEIRGYSYWAQKI